MADTLTLELDPSTADQLRRAAEESGETLEALAQRLLEKAALDLGESGEPLLSDAQRADLVRRLKDPGSYATAEEVDAFFARFRA